MMRRYLSILIILIGVILRWSYINWSLPYYFHPDETRLLYAVNEISWKTTFKVTNQSLEQLRNEGLPETILKALTRLVGQEITGENEFLHAVEQHLGSDQPDRYKKLILKQTTWRNLNPKFFAYGSLPIYVLKAVHESGKVLAEKTLINQTLVKLFKNPLRIDDFFLVGRAVSALFSSLTLIVLYFFGKRFFSRRVALFSTVFLAFTVLDIQLSHFLTVDVMLTFFIVLAMYFMVALVEGETPWRNYLLAGIAIGLALATKISALPLYVVFLGAHLLGLLKFRWASRLRLRSVLDTEQVFTRRSSLLPLWGIFIFALLLSGIVFLMCEPYALLDFKGFYLQTKEQSDMVRGIIQPPYAIQYEKTPPYLYHLTQLFFYSMGIPLGLLTLIGSLVITLDTIFRIKAYFANRMKGFDAYFTNSHRAMLLILLWVLPVFASVGGFKVKFLRYLLPLIPFLCLLGAIFIERLIQRFPSWKLLTYIVISLMIGFSAFYAVAFVSIYHRADPRTQASKWIYEHVAPGSTLLTEVWEFVSIVPVPGHDPGQYPAQELDLYSSDSEEKIRKLAQQLSQGDVIFLATKRLYGSTLRVPERYFLTMSYYAQLFDGNLGFTPVKPFTNYPSLLGITFNDDFADESFSVYDHPKVILFQKTRNFSENELYHRIIAAPRVKDPALFLKRLLAFPALESALPFAKGGPGGIFKSRPEWQLAALWLIAVELLAVIAFPLTTLTFRNLPDLGYAIAKVVGILLPAYIVWIFVNFNLFAYTREIIFVVVYILFLVALLFCLKHWRFFTEMIRTKWRIFLIYESVFVLAYSAFLLFRAYNPDIFWSESSMDFSFLTVLTRTDTLPPPDPWISGFPLNYYYFGHYLVATLTKLSGIPPQITYNLAFALFPALVIVEVFSLLYNLTRRYRWGLVGVVFSIIIGNLDGFFLLVDSWRGKEPYYRFFRCAHEVIPHTVHEFPFWTFIFVDLHAHLLNMPFLIAVFFVGFNLLSEDSHPLLGGGGGGSSPPLSWDRGVFPSLREGRGVFISALLPILLVGTLGVISSWDYPTGVIFLLLIAAFKTYRNFRQRRQKLKTQIRPLGYIIGVLIPGSLLLYAPFYVSFSRSQMGLGLIGNATTRLSDFLTFFGFFCFGILSFLIVQAWRIRKSESPWGVFMALLLFVAGIYTLMLHVFSMNYATLLFVLSLLLFSSYIFAKQKEWLFAPLVENTFIWMCLGYACLILAGCEVVFVRDFLQGGEWKRMNTIFKFYIPAWFLLSFVATYYLSQLYEYYVLQRRRMMFSLSRQSPLRYINRLWLIGFGVLFLMSVVFPVMGPYARRHQDVYNRVWLPPTIDGLAYLNVSNPDEYGAIRWLNESVVGTPVILEATGADYLYEYARISANTGLLTVIGWPSHVDQREHWGQTQQRVLDVKEIYASREIERVLLLLKQYHVAYIYIGETERRDFPEAGLKKFQNYPEYFEMVFQSGKTVIYRVK